MPCRVSGAYRRTGKWELEPSQGSLDCFQSASRSLPVGGISNAPSMNELLRFHINSYTALTSAHILYPLRNLYSQSSVSKNVCNHFNTSPLPWACMGENGQKKHYDWELYLTTQGDEITFLFLIASTCLFTWPLSYSCTVNGIIASCKHFFVGLSEVMIGYNKYPLLPSYFT